MGSWRAARSRITGGSSSRTMRRRGSGSAFLFPGLGVAGAKRKVLNDSKPRCGRRGPGTRVEPVQRCANFGSNSFEAGGNRRHIRKCFWLRWHDAMGRELAPQWPGNLGRQLKTALYQPARLAQEPDRFVARRAIESDPTVPGFLAGIGSCDAVTPQGSTAGCGKAARRGARKVTAPQSRSHGPIGQLSGPNVGCRNGGPLRWSGRRPRIWK